MLYKEVYKQTTMYKVQRANSKANEQHSSDPGRSFSPDYLSLQELLLIFDDVGRCAFQEF